MLRLLAPLHHAAEDVAEWKKMHRMQRICVSRVRMCRVCGDVTAIVWTCGIPLKISNLSQLAFTGTELTVSS